MAAAEKVVTLKELREHTTKDNIWVLLDGKGQSHNRSSVEASDDLL